MDTFTIHVEAHESVAGSGVPVSLQRHRERIEKLWATVDRPLFRKLVRLRVLHAAVTGGREEAARVSDEIVVHRRDRSRWLLEDPDEWLKRMEEAWLGPEKKVPSYRKLSEADWNVVAGIIRNQRHLTWEEMAWRVRTEASREGSTIPHLKKMSASTLCRASELLKGLLGEEVKPPTMRRRTRKLRQTGKKRSTTTRSQLA